MITRLSIPDAATFSTTDGVYPYYHKYTTPVFKVRYADTPYTVNNNGLTTYWYESLNNAIAGKATSYTAQFPVAKFYFANGYPPFYSMPNDQMRWAMKFKCQFYAAATANYHFAFGGSGLVSSAYIKVDNVAAGSLPNNLKFENTDYTKTKTYAFNGKTWHQLEFIYDSNKTIGTNVDEYGLIALWKTDSASFTPEYIPLSAGVCCCPNSATTANKLDGETINWTTLSDVSDVRYSIGRENIGALQFSVPFVATTYFTQGGYVNYNGNLKHAAYGNVIKKYRKVEYYEGYRSATNNKAILFAGAANSKVTVPYHESLKCEKAITIEFWYKPNFASGETLLQMPRASGSINSSQYGIYWSNVSNSLFGFVYDGFGTNVNLLCTVNDNQWHHFVFTMDGTYWQSYLDGIQKLTNHSKTNTPNWTGSGTYPLHLGQTYDGSTGLNRYNGCLDEVRIYNRAISLAEVEFNANRLNGSPLNSDGLVLWLKADEGTGSTLADKSGWGNNGTLSVATWTDGNVPYIDEFVKKFTGQTKEFENSYNKDGNDSVNVICEDFSSFMKESFNLYAPSAIDYLQAGYFSDSRTSYNKVVNGKTKPVAFDGWDIYKFVQIMGTESYIDPYLFYKKKLFSNRAGTKVFGGYKIDMTNSTSNATKFPIQTNYGNVDNIDPQLKSDDEYIFKIDTGEYYYDAVINALQPYYYNFYFDEHGHPCMSSFNTPTTYLDDRDFTRTSWSDSTSAKMSSYKTTYSSARSYVASANFTGVCADVLFLAGPRMGHTTIAATNSVTVDIKYGTTVLQSYDINLYSSTVRGIYDGVDPILGYNPCVYRVGVGLPYDTYRLVITPKNGYPVFLDGAFIYDKDVENATHTFESGDANSKGSIVSLNVETKAKDLRNDVYVYGALRGDLRAYNKDSEYVVVNPNNPIRRYNYSIVRDISSIYSTSAANYVGRPIRMLVQDPKIFNEEQANSVAFNILSVYRNPAKQMNLSVVGNPMVQIDDCITIKDSFKQYASANVWVSGVTSDVAISSENARYITTIETSPVKPPDGYVPKISPTLPAGGAIQNIYTIDSGQKIKLVADISTSATVITIKATPASVGCGYIPPKGYMRIFSTTTGFSYLGSTKYKEEIIYYERRYPYTSTASTILASCMRGLQGSTAQSHKAGLEFYACFDPYMTEKMGIYPQVKFDLYRKGKLKVGVYGHFNDGSKVLVANLTGIGKENSEFGEYDDVDWGTYTYQWNCIDNLGEYNRRATLGEVAEGSYVSELERPPVYYKDGYGIHGTFSFDIELQDRENNITYATSTKALGDKGCVYIHRGSPGIIEFKVHTSGLYHYFQTAGGETAAQVFSSAKSFGSNIYAIFSPYVKSSSNNSQGFKYSIKDVSHGVSSDKFEARRWLMDVTCNILHVGRLELQNQDLCPVFSNLNAIKVTDDKYNVIYNNGSGLTYYFNPNTYRSDKPIRKIPSEVIEKIKAYIYPNDLYETKLPDSYIFNNFIFFTGNIFDRSGRPAYITMNPSSQVIFLPNGGPGTSHLVYAKSGIGLIDIFNVEKSSFGLAHKDRNNIFNATSSSRTGAEFMYRCYNNWTEDRFTYEYVWDGYNDRPERERIDLPHPDPISNVVDGFFANLAYEFRAVPFLLWYGEDYPAANRFEISQNDGSVARKIYSDIISGMASKECPLFRNAETNSAVVQSNRYCQSWYKMSRTEIQAL